MAGHLVRRAAFAGSRALLGAAGHPIGKGFRLVDRSERWTGEELQAHQDRALSALVRHCYDDVPYYRNVMQARKLTPHDIRTVADLAKLPYLTRDIVRREGPRLRAVSHPDAACRFRRSGGTTGEPLRIALDAGALGIEAALYVRGLRWMGHVPGRPILKLFGGSLGLPAAATARSRVRDLVMNSRFLPAFELTPDNVREYAAAIQRAEGGVLLGYTSAMLNLVEYMSACGLSGSALSSAICTAEYMPEPWRRRIAGVLGVPVYNYYGCGEVNSIAYERAGDAGYVVSQEHVVLEAGESAAEEYRDAGEGPLAATTLFNYAMPLIRYAVGDRAELAWGQDGRQRIVSLGGRVTDQLSRRDGSTISGSFIPHIVFQSGFPAWKYQVVQRNIDRITVHYLMSGATPLPVPARDTLQLVLQSHLGQSIHVEFVEGDFELTPAGKHRLVINHLQSTRSSANEVQVHG